MGVLDCFLCSIYSVIPFKYPSSTPGVTGTTTTTATSAASGLSDVSRQGYVPLAKPGDPLCQTLLDTVAAHIKSPVLNHTLQRTFGPAIQAINGSPIRYMYIVASRFFIL